MNSVNLSQSVYYVGAIDWTLRDFHGYTTPRGVTYNSYLIIDEKICLVDTVKAPFAGELINRISQIVDPAKIDYVVVNHVEPDHSSALPAIMAKAPNAKVFITAQGKEELIKHYQQEYDFQLVKEGDCLDLGSKKLHFVPLPMLHWPDSMVSYLDGEEILFSNDAFGQHISTTKRLDVENNISDIMYESAKYYANILMPFGSIVVKALEKVKKLPIKMIAPSHGIVWTKYIPEIIKKYQIWGNGQTEAKVIIAYDSMWGATEQMARRILDGVAAAGVTGNLYRLSSADRSEVVWDILEAKGVLIGSSTLNNGVLPNTGALLVYLKGLRPKNKLAAAFGAYGWGGGAQKFTEELLTGANVTTVAGLSLKWVPTPEELDRCFEFGLEFGKKVLMSQSV